MSEKLRRNFFDSPCARSMVVSLIQNQCSVRHLSTSVLETTAKFHSFSSAAFQRLNKEVITLEALYNINCTLATDDRFVL